MTERNKFKLELSASDSLYNLEVRKYNTLDSIVKAKDYEINLLDSAYTMQREINLNLEKKNKTLKTVTIASVCVAIVSTIFTILK
jgi:hypothetical protein